MELQALVGIAGVPFIVALVQLVKPFISDDRWIPVVTLGTGLVLNVGLAFAIHTDPATGAVAGLVAGMTASGLYSSTKKLAGL